MELASTVIDPGRTVANGDYYCPGVVSRSRLCWLESRGRYAEAEKVMRAIEEGVVLQTGKPLPPVVIEDDGKARAQFLIRPY